MIKVSNELVVYEVDGVSVASPIDGPRVHVRSHWNRNELVVVELEGKRMTLVAKDLLAAISNATNTARF